MSDTRPPNPVADEDWIRELAGRSGVEILDTEIGAFDLPEVDEVDQEEQAFFISVTIDQLAGQQGADDYPIGSTAEDIHEIELFARRARDAVKTYDFAAAYRHIDELEQAVQEIEGRARLYRPLDARLFQIELDLEDAHSLTPDERTPLDVEARRIRELLEVHRFKDLDSAIGTLEGQLSDLLDAPSFETVQTRASHHAYAGNVPVATQLYRLLLVMKPDTKEWHGPLKVKLKQLRVMPYDVPVVTVFRIDGADGRHHAWERHTFEGIWATGAVLTAHPTSVAIFDSEDDLDAAVRDTPTAVARWQPGRQSGRVDTQLGAIHYQGEPEGDRLYLRSVYPTNKNHPLAKVKDALNEPSFEAFKAFILS